MGLKIFRQLFASALLVLSAIAGYSQESLQVLHRHVRPEVSSGQAEQVGSLPPGQRLNFTIVLPLRNRDELTGLLGRLYDPTSPDFRHFLSVEQFTRQFGPTFEDYRSVVEFAQANGFTVTGTPTNRLIVPISGSVAQIEKAFHVGMKVYRHPTEERTFYSPDREPSLNLSVAVEHITGLNNFSLPRPTVTKAAMGQAIANNSGSGPGGSYLASDMRAAYYTGTLPTGVTALTGINQTVGILEFDGYNIGDVASSFAGAATSSANGSNYVLSYTPVAGGANYSIPVNNVLLDGASGAPVTGDDAEQVLDIVQAIGMAPGLSQVRVYVGDLANGTDDAKIFNAMATENIAKQLSVSWAWNPDDPATDDVFFQEFAAQGQSLFVASGDSGAFDANFSPFFYPAEDDYVTAVGGTHMSTYGAGGPWASEVAWNSSAAGSGGGISPDGISIPSWQAGVANSSNGGSTTLRNVPDVAMEADFDNYNCDMGACNGDWAGTSFASPRWAGFMALINQQAEEAGTAHLGGLGLLNPLLYSIGEGSGYNNDMHDITNGNNDSAGQPAWYSAVSGYDLVTGWGSPAGQNLINALAGPQASGLWITNSSGSFLSVNQGGSSTSTISVIFVDGLTGSVNLAVSGLPSGVSASWSSNPTTTSSVLTLTASSSAASGTTLVTITGTSGALTATTTLVLTIYAASFTLSASPDRLGVPQHAFGTSTIRVKPEFGFTGNVSLAATGLPAGVSASWSANPTSGSSILTLTASSSTNFGTTTIAITGTSGALTATVPLTLSAVGGSATTLALTASGTPVTSVASGTIVALTAAVSAGSTAVTTGQVNFCDATAVHCEDSHLLGTAQLTSAGTAVLKFAPGIGSHSYKAVFLGFQGKGGSSSNASALTVTGGTYASTASIAQNGNQGDYTLTATVTGPGPAPPTGSVSFLDTSNADGLLATAPLVQGGEILDWLNPQSPATQTLPEFVAVGDFNGDGIPDLAVTNELSRSVTILLGNGDGTFSATAVSPRTGLAPEGLAVGDFNGDGIADLAVANAGADTLTILLGNGDGTFTPAASPATGSNPTAVAVGDFNRDGIPDLAVTNGGSNTVTILLGNGDGTFTLASSPATGSGPISVAVGDFNGDGIPDLAVANQGTTTATILLGNGDGTFTPTANPPATFLTNSVVVADFNGDGIPDLALTDWEQDWLTIVLGNGDGTFTPAASPVTGYTPNSVAVGDFNGDGIPDLAVANFNGNNVTVLLGNGDGTFSPAASPGTGETPFSIAVGDFTRNGVPALAVANYGSDTVTILTTQVTRTATATASGISPLGAGAHQVDASYSGDALYGSSISTTTALTAQLGAPMVTVTPSSSTMTLAQQLHVTVTVNGTTGDPTPSGTVTLSSGSYSSVATALASGSASITIPVAVLLIGADTLTARYSGDNNYHASLGTATETVTAGTLSVLTSPIPGNHITGPTVTFAWSAATGAAVYQLWLGTTGAGSSDLYNSGQTTATSATVSGLPSGGETVYARLFTTNHGVQSHFDCTYIPVTMAALTSPSPGSTLSGANVTFTWSAVTGATGYSLWLGTTGAGSDNVYDSGELAGTSAAVAPLPANGETIYARLFTNFNGVVAHADFTYTDVTQAVLTSPAPGSVLPGEQATFKWTAPAEATGYQIWLGTTGVGSNNVSPGFVLTATSLTVGGWLTDGETIYVRLFTSFNGTWVHSDYTYIALTQLPAKVTFPAPGSTLPGTTVTFTWPQVTGAAYYLFYMGIGTATGNMHSEPVSGNSATVVGLPANGDTIYVNLITAFLNDANSQGSQATFTAVTEATLTSPSPGSALTGSTATFTCTPMSKATGYQLWLGSAGVGSNNLYNSGVQTTTSFNVSGLPTVGAPVYARLFTTANGVQAYVDYIYTEATQAALTSPTPGSVFVSPTVTFTWTAVTGATGYSLWLGSTGVGSNNLYDSGETTATSFTAKGLPTNGETIYARLYTNIKQAAQHVDYTYTAESQPVIITQPANQTVVDGYTATFSVAATGVPSLTYQWQYLSGSTWKAFGAGTGYTTATLTTFATTAAYNGLQLRVVVTDGDGLTATSSTATLTVGPAITTQPVSQTVAVGSSATYSVVAAGVPTLTYQWQYLNGTAWKAFGAGTGYNTATLTTFATTAAYNGLQLRVVVTDGNGISATSSTATLTVH